jgi:hypothetical protein
MAGNPKKRASRESAEARAQELEQQLADTMAAAGGIPSAVPGGRARAAPRHLRAVAPPSKRPVAQSGAETRRMADHASASEIAQLSMQLRPGLRVQIERTKPHWCAGLCEEDYIVDHGGVGEMLAHIRHEWGGAAYRLTVSQPNGVVAYETRLQIAAPPRHETALITRATWNGEEPARAPAPTPNPRPAQDTSPLELMREMVKMMGAMQQAQHAPVTLNLERLEQQNERLVSALVAKNGQDVQAQQKTPSLREQLDDLAEGHAAVERMGKMFGGPRSGGDDAEEDSMINVALKEATKHFVGSAIASQFGGGKADAARAPAPARAPARAHMGAPARARENPVLVEQKLQIPSAGIAGQKRPS